MNDEELKHLWCKQKLYDSTKLSPDDQIKLMRIKLNALDRASLWVDAIIIGGAAVLIIWFGWYFLNIPLLARIGLVIMITSLAFDIWKPVRARRVSPQPTADAPVTQWLRHKLEKVRAECELSRTRLLWDLLPSWIGAIVFCWGLEIDLSSRIFFSAVITGTSGIIYMSSWKLKQYTRRKADQPLKEELEALLRVEETTTLPKE